MDDQLLLHLYHRLFDLGNLSRPRRCTYSDGVVVLIYFLAVLRDRSLHWAQDRRNEPLWMRKLPRPSYSQLMRRLKSRSVLTRIAHLNLEFRRALPSGNDKFCDGKPLVIGGFSKDPDADDGKLPGGYARGYKVHVIIDACGAVDLFTVTPLSAGEPTVTATLLPWMNLANVTLRGDSNYDSNNLYAAVAEHGGRLIAPRKKSGTGLGHGEHHPHRLLAIQQLEQDQNALPQHRRHRIRVEQALGHLTNLPFGLSPLPNFVRRQTRVRLWVLAKITLYHLYLKLTKTFTQAA